MNLQSSRWGILACIVVGLGIPGIAVADSVKTVRVDCTRGETIAKALEQGDERKPLLVLVRGSCNESVIVSRNDVTLRGDVGFGGAINGPDPALDTITVSANRVAIEGLAVSGGQNGIRALGAGALTISGSTVRSTARSGIIVIASSGAVIDQSTVELNPRDGVAIEGSQATITNSTVSRNARFGVFVGMGAAARVGIDNGNNAAGSTISQNGASGINILLGGSAVIGNNQITQNGTDAASTAGRSGIAIVQATAEIAGANTIADNAGEGIFARSAAVQIGNPSFAFTTVNTISGNGKLGTFGGISAELGSALRIRDAVISGNGGFGMQLSMRSHAQISGSQIQNNVPRPLNPPNIPGDGIRLLFGSALQALGPPSVVTPNPGSPLLCSDGESSVVNVSLLGLSLIIPPPPPPVIIPPPPPPGVIPPPPPPVIVPPPPPVPVLPGGCTGFENLQ